MQKADERVNIDVKRYFVSSVNVIPKPLISN